MPIIPAATVAAPEPLGRRYGLLTAAAGPLPLPEPHGLGGGIEYEAVSCGAARRTTHDCPDPDPPTKVFETGDHWVTAEPFVVYSGLRCGAAGQPPNNWEARVRRRLANGEQAAVERHLGILLAAAATPIVAPTPTSIASVVGELEQWLYGGGTGEQGYGNVGYLHASIRLASFAHDLLDLSKDSAGRLRTRMGTVLVFGDYPDDGSIFITGHVTTYKAAEVAVAPRAQLLNTTTNQQYMLAEQEWAVAWDCHAGVSDFTVEGTS